MNPIQELKSRMAQDDYNFVDLATKQEFNDMGICVGMMMTAYLMGERGMSVLEDIVYSMVQRTKTANLTRRIYGDYQTRHQARITARRIAKKTIEPFRQEEADAMLKEITEDANSILQKCKKFTTYMEHGSKFVMRAGTKSAFENFDNSQKIANQWSRMLTIIASLDDKQYKELEKIATEMYNSKELSNELLERFSNVNI